MTPPPRWRSLSPRSTAGLSDKYRQGTARNPYYGAGGATAENSGYNHSEIKFDRRDHDDPGGRYFRGQRNTPVEQQERWLEDIFRPNL